MSKVRYEDVRGVQIPRIDYSDPKRTDKIVPFKPDQIESPANSIELQSVAAMVLAGSAMILRQKCVAVFLGTRCRSVLLLLTTPIARLFCWLSLAASLSAFISAGSFFETTQMGQSPVSLVM
jgi:hypothetical protein